MNVNYTSVTNNLTFRYLAPNGKLRPTFFVGGFVRKLSALELDDYDTFYDSKSGLTEVKDGGVDINPNQKGILGGAGFVFRTKYLDFQPEYSVMFGTSKSSYLLVDYENNTAIYYPAPITLLSQKLSLSILFKPKR